MVVGQMAAVPASPVPWDRSQSFPVMPGALFHLETKHLTSESGSLPLPLAGCAVLDKLPGHHELSFPCLSTEIRCDTAVSNGFNHACAKPTCKVWHRASHHAWAVGLPFWELVSLLA